MKKTTAVLSVLIFFLTSSMSYAGMGSYMSNVMSQFSNLSPHAYHMQQRGFFVGGTMKIPPMGEEIQPLSITLPSFKNNSCGGIDATMGGFSYLNFHYLVQKLQGIIQAAPALAFEIAIKVLSEKLGGVMNVLEAATDAINGLNFNSCTAMNGIVTTASNAITNMINGASQNTVNGTANGGNNWFGAAITNAYDSVKNSFDSWISNIEETATSQEQAADSDASQHASEYAGGINSNGLLNTVSSDLGNLPSGFIRMMRYYLGDVYAVENTTPPQTSNGTTSSNGTGYILRVLEPCGQDASPQQFVADLANDTMHEISFNQLLDGDCDGVTVNGNTLSLFKQTQQNLINIAESLTPGSGVVVSQQTQNLINISPIPVYAFIRDATLVDNISGGPSSDLTDVLSEQLAKPVAISIAAEFGGYFIEQVAAAASRAEARMSMSSKKEDTKAINSYIKQLEKTETAVEQVQNQAMEQARQIYGSFMQRYTQMQQIIDQNAMKYQMEAQLKFAKRGRGL